ncbi:MAG: hypothetical protein QW372_07050 [Nitrososphaerales archaeon]
MEIPEKIQLLEKLEDKAIFCSLAMMSYNPSIGRVLKKGGVDQFIHISWEAICKVQDIQSCDEFDKWHDQFVERIMSTIGTTSRGEKISYGQAQKPINVFLKVYIDWAGLPRPQIAIRLRPYLHVPLDSVVMKYIKQHFRQYYHKFNLITVRLSEMNREQYYSWQKCFRELHTKKPLIVDVFWAVKRFNKVLNEIVSSQTEKRALTELYQ